MLETEQIVKEADDYFLIRGKKIPVTLREVPQHDLRFYLENPRLYSIVRADGDEPTDREIEEQLLQMDHVKALVQSIQLNGGLIDPVIVRGGDMVVLEGNSRLAAYRALARKDPVRWGLMKVKLLPADIGESDVFALLGEYHIHGKTNWSPYEQAGYLYRRHRNQKIPVDTLAREINLTKGEINHLIEVRDFMLKHSEDQPTRWSYYDEYLRPRNIDAARKEYPELDDLVVEKIRSSEIKTAQDLRDGLRKICKAGGRTLSRFVDKKMDFEQACESATDKGVGDATYQRLEKFRKWIVNPDTHDELAEESTFRKQFTYELEQIQKACTRIAKKLSPPA